MPSKFPKLPTKEERAQMLANAKARATGAKDYVWKGQLKNDLKTGAAKAQDYVWTKDQPKSKLRSDIEKRGGEAKEAIKKRLPKRVSKTSASSGSTSNLTGDTKTVRFAQTRRVVGKYAPTKKGMQDRAAALSARLKRQPPKDALVTLEAAQIEDVAKTPKKARFDVSWERLRKARKDAGTYVERKTPKTRQAASDLKAGTVRKVTAGYNAVATKQGRDALYKSVKPTRGKKSTRGGIETRGTSIHRVDYGQEQSQPGNAMLAAMRAQSQRMRRESSDEQQTSGQKGPPPPPPRRRPSSEWSS